MSEFKVAVIVGSDRRDSLNGRLAKALMRLGPPGVAFRRVAIDDLPLYNQDLEADLPGSVSRFKAEIEAADALLFVTPEHSRSIPALLKNAIDWGTRPWGRNSWAGKPAAIAGTSPGAMGTALAQQHLRFVLGAIGIHVMGGEAYLTYRPEMVSEAGDLADPDTRGYLKAYVEQFAAYSGRHVAAPRAAA